MNTFPERTKLEPQTAWRVASRLSSEPLARAQGIGLGFGAGRASGPFVGLDRPRARLAAGQRGAGRVGTTVRAGAASIDLYWLPLGAGGRSVRLNGQVFEAIQAARARRPRGDLYHAALELRCGGARFVIEMTPLPNVDGGERGVVAEGPVGSSRLSRFRLFRYELRCWRDGVIPDVHEAVASPVRFSADPSAVRQLLELAASVPTCVWGRDELQVGEMWTSNSVVSWLLVRSGLPVNSVRPPAGGRAPGWDAGVAAARRDESQVQQDLADAAIQACASRAVAPNA